MIWFEFKNGELRGIEICGIKYDWIVLNLILTVGNESDSLFSGIERY